VHDPCEFCATRPRTLHKLCFAKRVELPYRAIKTNIADSLNVVVHVERRPGRRYISEVLLVNSYDPDADLFGYGAVFLAKQDRP